MYSKLHTSIHGSANGKRNVCMEANAKDKKAATTTAKKLLVNKKLITSF